jgi:glycosyltransferase involved in cell wall biosynthesis
MKLACVVHRYGSDIAGGSEAHCRALARRLGTRHQVTVLTTCARDHLTWRNAHPPGLSSDGPVTVRRFPVERPRQLQRFAEVSERLAAGPVSVAEEEAWFRENGPDAPTLLEHLARCGAEYDWILFWAYRYAPSFFGLPLVRDRALLLPTAEEDPLLGASVLPPFFALPRGYLFLTGGEARRVSSRCAGPLPPSCVIGAGIDPAPEVVDESILDRLGIAAPFLLYLGRIDPNKGCDRLFRYFDGYLAAGGPAVPLVMAGPAAMPVPDHPWIRPLGFVDAATRDALLARATLLVMPSPFESLSLVLLEAWSQARPVLVNARCEVLLEQTLRSGGGLHYRDAREFAECLRFLLERPDVACELGRRGCRFVEEHYRWSVVLEKVERFLESLAPTA